MPHLPNASPTMPAFAKAPDERARMGRISGVLLIYAAFFFPTRWAWPLSIELILIAGTPLLYDASAIDDAFLPRYVALVAGFLSATWVLVGLRERLLDAELRQRAIAYRDSLTGVANRRQFDATLQRELSRRSQTGLPADEQRPLGLLLLDLDDLKGINALRRLTAVEPDRAD